MAGVLHTAPPGLLVESNQLFFPFLNALDVTRQERMEIGVPGGSEGPCFCRACPDEYEVNSPLVLLAPIPTVLLPSFPPIQHHCSSEHETGDWCEQTQRDHREEHLGFTVAAPQALQAEPHLPGEHRERLPSQCVLINPLLKDLTRKGFHEELQIACL